MFRPSYPSLFCDHNEYGERKDAINVIPTHAMKLYGGASGGVTPLEEAKGQERTFEHGGRWRRR